MFHYLKIPRLDDIATQADMNGLEELGLLKMDFLGLRNLTVINKTIKSLKNRHNKKIDIHKIDLNDIKVYNLFFLRAIL